MWTGDDGNGGENLENILVKKKLSKAGKMNDPPAEVGFLSGISL